MLKPFIETTVNLNFICIFSLYSTVNIQEIIANYADSHTKHINTLCGQNVELLNVKLAVHTVTTGLQRVKSML